MKVHPISVCQVTGVEVAIHPSFFVTLALFTVIGAWGADSLVDEGLKTAAFVLMVFASIIVHELGHAHLARRFGVEIQTVVLHLLGGEAKMSNPPPTPRAEWVIALAGPSVSLCLGGASLLLFALLPDLGLVAELVGFLGMANIVIGLFNLVPILPMDGGRVLRACLTARFGHLAATKIAVVVARGCSILIALLGVALGQYLLVGIAAYMWLLGARELRFAKLACAAR